MQRGIFLPANLRKTILRMAYAGNTVHIGCAFSIIEILAVVYRSHMNLGDGVGLNAEGRDYLILSKGHGVMAQYACLYELGWLAESEIDTYFADGTRLKGLSDTHIPGLEVTSGSLGHGLSVGIGLALAAKRNKSGQRCYAIVGDGEMNEGAMWEGLLFAAHFKLGNLIVIVDENRYQAMGKTSDIMSLGSLREKFESFGFDSKDIDGHDESAIDAALVELKALNNGRPKVVIAKTIKGKGVDFMENNNMWHYTRLTEDSYLSALRKLEQE